MLEALDQGPYRWWLNTALVTLTAITCSRGSTSKLYAGKILVAATAASQKCVSHVSMKASKFSLYQECIKGGGRVCNCTSWLWSRRKCSLMPKYSRPQTNCEVFKWVAEA